MILVLVEHGLIKQKKFISILIRKPKTKIFLMVSFLSIHQVIQKPWQTGALMEDSKSYFKMEIIMKIWSNDSKETMLLDMVVMSGIPSLTFLIICPSNHENSTGITKRWFVHIITKWTKGKLSCHKTFKKDEILNFRVMNVKPNSNLQLATTDVCFVVHMYSVAWHAQRIKKLWMKTKW